MYPLVLLGDEAHVEARFIYLNTVLISTQYRCTVCAECTMSQKSFWTHPTELIGDVGHVESRFDPFGDGVSIGGR
jgi:hypothetical protein